MTPRSGAAPPGAASPPRWWLGAVGYEVYIRSFADADGDGVGDLAGLAAHVGHLADLGIDTIWITPFYPSPMRDHGYDVADYNDIAPVFGDLAQFDALLADVHRRGMRLIVDLVPNHSSCDHPWFLQARSSRQDPYRDYYVWRDPAPGGGPPNNWLAAFGGNAWTLDEVTGQYWLHLFLPEQPDLNWTNPRVADEFEAILRFWLERGVDGFRIDVAHALVKHPELPDNPPAPQPDPVALGEVVPDWEEFEHRYDSDQPGVLDVHRRWRKVADEYGAVLVGEVYLLQADRLRRYLIDDDGMHLAFWFPPLHLVTWSPAAIRGTLREGVELALSAGADLAWVQGSHDRPRAAGRYGGGRMGRDRQLAMAALQCFLPGTPFLYQGEELGLDNPVIPRSAAQDPVALHGGRYELTRDVARTPIPWSPGPGLGFTTAASAWLPFGDIAPADTVAVQGDDPDSALSTYRRLLALRRRALPAPDAAFSWLAAHDDVVAFQRGDVMVAANLGEADVPLAVPPGRTVAFSTDRHMDGEQLGATLQLAAREAVVLR